MVVKVSLTLFKAAIFFFKQKTAYEMRISDWSSDVCSSDLLTLLVLPALYLLVHRRAERIGEEGADPYPAPACGCVELIRERSCPQVAFQSLRMTRLNGEQRQEGALEPRLPGPGQRSGQQVLPGGTRASTFAPRSPNQIKH